jgi:hypothetical protein
MTEAEESISKGFDISLKNPTLFLPALAPIIIGIIFDIIALFTFWYVLLVGSLIAYIVGAVACFIIVDMANDILNNRPADLTKSLNAVLGRFGTLILAAIIAAIFSITIILLPIALFLITITVVDNVDALEGTKRSFDFALNNLKETVIFMIIVVVVQIIFSVVLSLIPIVGPFLASIISWCLIVIFLVASVRFYLTLRALPPPPPPPP